MTISIRIDNDTLTVSEPCSIVSGSKNYYELRAAFTSDWNGLSKYVIFPSEQCSTAMTAEDSAIVPEALTAKSGILIFGLIGLDSGGNLRIATNYVRLRILEGACEIDAAPPSPDDSATWESYIGEIAQKWLDQIKEAADSFVKGPASATDGRVAVFDGATGKLIKDGGVLLSALAKLASPTFTGTPKAPTAAKGTSSTQLATTEFVAGAVKDVTDRFPVKADDIADNAVTAGKISSGAVTEGKIGTGAVTTGKIAGGAVTAAKLGLGAVTEEKLDDEAVGTGKLQDGAVTTDKIEGGAVTEFCIADGAVTTEKIGREAVETTNIGPMAVTTEKIDDGAVTQEKLASKSVGNDQIQLGSISNGKIQDKTITGGKLADKTVTGDKIAERTVGLSNLEPGSSANTVLVTVYENNQYETHWRQIDSSMIMDKQIQNSDIKDNSIVGSEKLQAKSVTGGRIADKTVGTDQLADKCISADKLQAGSVSQAKIQDKAVTEGKLADGAVTTGKIAVTAVTAGKIASGAVTEEKIGTGAVTTGKIAARAVTGEKLAEDVAADVRLFTYKGTSANFEDIMNANEWEAGWTWKSQTVISYSDDSYYIGAGDYIIAVKPHPAEKINLYEALNAGYFLVASQLSSYARVLKLEKRFPVKAADIADNAVTADKLGSDVKVGSLADLTTRDKSSVVAAINELRLRVDELTAKLGQLQ